MSIVMIFIILLADDVSGVRVCGLSVHYNINKMFLFL